MTGLNEFYGSDSQLRQYHKAFLPYLYTSRDILPVLDLGCGSGVFLELLRARGIVSVGIDKSDEAINWCRDKKLDPVFLADALSFLGDKHECYASIFCAHLIEHFDPPNASRLLALAQQALVPSGRLILLTPNPVSLAVISEVFWLDPTHVRPYPLALLTRMVERAGLHVVASGHRSAPGSPRRELPRRWLLRILLGRHYGGMDSFVVGEKR